MPTPTPAPDVYPCAYIGYAFVDNVATPYVTGIRVLEASAVLGEATTGEGTMADNQFYLDGVMAVPGTEVNFQILYDCGSGAEWLSADETATHEQYGRVEVNLHSGCLHDLALLADPVEGGVATGSGTYDYCANVAINAYPADERWYFDHWTGEGIADPHSASTTALIDADKTVRAMFNSAVDTIHIDADPFLFCYPGVTFDLPEALTNIGPDGLDIVTVIWGTVDGQWASYDAEMGVGNLRELVNGNPYVMTHEDGLYNEWDIPQ